MTDAYSLLKEDSDYILQETGDKIVIEPATFLEIVEGVLTFTGIAKKKIFTAITGVLSFTGSLSTLKVIQLLIEGILSFSGAISKSIKKVIIGSLTFSGLVRKKISITITGVLTFGAVVGRLIKITIVGTLSFAGTVAGFLVKLFPRNLRRIILLIRDKK